jgi:hypothetical protein
MNDARQCPACGGKLRIRTSKPLANLREAFRECTRCHYRDVVKIRPAEILSIRVVSTTVNPSLAAATAVI